MRTLRTLLTGFGPFLDVSDNPSSHIAEHFAACGAPGHELTVRLLPVSFHQTGELLPPLLREGGFDLVVHLGVAAREKGIRLERYGRNRTRGASPDVDGFAPGDRPVVPGAPEAYKTAIPLFPLRTRLRNAGLQTRVSHDAGGYVCNWTYYTTLHTIATECPPARALFIHVPEATPAFPLEQQISAVRLVLAYTTG